MNLQHERMLTLCETLNLPFIAQAHPLATQDAAQQETAYSDFLEPLLSVCLKLDNQELKSTSPLGLR